MSLMKNSGMHNLPPLRRTKSNGAYSSLIAFIFVLASVVYLIISRTSELPQYTNVNNATPKIPAENSTGKEALQAGGGMTLSNEPTASEGSYNKVDSGSEDKIATDSEEKLSAGQNVGQVTTSTYLSHNGDTLKKIAIRLYGKSKSTAALARRNPTITLQQILPAGVSIILPPELKKIPQK
jgi:phage tail protein X